MDLIPVTSEEDEEELGPRQIKLSATARELAEIRTAPVERKWVTHVVRMVGKIDYDETRLAHITAWVPGRLDRLFADFTGVRVRKNAPLVSLYSPELYAAQEELLQAVKQQKLVGESSLSSVRNTARLTVDAVREKLRLWGLTGDQIDEIIERGEPSTHLTIRAPISGTVIHKNAFQGMYVSTGTRIYTISDLSSLWVQLEAYESDLAFLGPGQQVEFTTETYPGETFKGRIAFIDPELNRKTRTVRVRVEVGNPDGRLKPEMFVRATVRTDMQQARSESRHDSAPLVIPASAPLITGTRAVVYVEVHGKEGVYEGREVALGPRAGDYYLVREGLEEGEMVVVNGNFKIDSAIQILAKPSMMSPEGGGPAPGHQHHSRPGPQGDAGAKETPADEKTVIESARAHVPAEFRDQLQEVFKAYFEIQRELAGDNLKGAGKGGGKLLDALKSVDMTLLEGPVHVEWMNHLKSLRSRGARLKEAGDIEKARVVFASLSQDMSTAVDRYGAGGPKPIISFHCPMALDNRGAVWLQDHGDTRNPYFGAVMLKCQDRIDTLYQGSRQAAQGEHKHE